MLRSKSIVVTEEELEPQVTSSDPNERKLARRLRIERRWEALKKSKLNIREVDSTAEEQNNAIQIQLQKSAELLEKFLLEGEEYITNVRVANDSREVDRRESEGLTRENIMGQLEEEAQSADEMFNKIASKWGSIQKYNDPLHVNEDIMDQKEKCEILIKQKDGIISMLNDELKNAERIFTKDQTKQIEDINTLTKRIEKQITFMRKAYRLELEIIEEVILQERKNLIDSTDKKWEELYKKRENQEIWNSNKKFDQLEDFDHRMTKLRMDFQEHYRETKIKLENDIEELQRELERIKALALLNSEKLDYNYQILKKREDENIIIKSQQKRRMNKLQDVINDLRAQISEYESCTSNKIKKLGDNIKKLHKSILDVEAKADHFAHVNDEKFHMVWELNKKNVQSVLRKILETDKILYEQQMGLDWEAPVNFIVDKKTLTSYKVALNKVEPAFIHEAFQESDSIAVKIKKTTSQTSKMIEPLEENEEETAMYKKVLKHILVRISDKSGFLAEKRLKVLLRGYEDDQKNLVRLDNVFEALGIQDSAYIKILFLHFLPYTYCPVCQGSMVITTSRTDSQIKSTSSQISSMFSRFGESENLQITELDEVIDAIRQPDSILERVISDLVTSEDFYEDSSSDQSDQERIEDICGAPDMDQYFTEKTKEKVKISAARKKISGTKMSDSWYCQYHHPLVIGTVYVLKALREFVSSYYVGKVGVPTTGARLERKRLTISRYLSEKDIKSYWEKFKLNFGEDRVRVWDALLSGLKKYLDILKDRKTLCDDVIKLRKENADLKRLLANYLDHGEYMTPPCANERENFKPDSL